MAASRGLWRKAQMFSYFFSSRRVLFPTNTRIRSCFTAPGSSEEGSFEEMFRNSSFVKMGRPQGKTVVGRITHIVEHDWNRDLYVDFGWKFHAVCTEGRKRGSHYKVNDLIRITLTNLEAAGHFLGQTRHITLCEADAKLEGILEKDQNYSVVEKELS